MAGDDRPIASDVAFTPTVKALQERKGSRRAYARMEDAGSWQTQVTPALANFIAQQRSFFLATATADGQPYVQHRGGPPGFLHVVDEHTLAFLDFAGNRQYISSGNLADNDKAQLFLIDYRQRKRIKIWGTARIVEATPAHIAQWLTADYPGRAEQVLLFTVTAWDANCPQHIPLRFDAEDVEYALAERDARIAQLTAEVARLRSHLPRSPDSDDHK